MKRLLILASGSPRRKKILKEAGFKFRVFIPNSSERFAKNLTLSQALKKISDDKARACLDALYRVKTELVLILSADTVVISQGKVLGKPKSRKDALRMLKILSGQTHQVKTSFTLLAANFDSKQQKYEVKRRVSRIITTYVLFRRIADDELVSYVDSKEPFDKAGSYAIQGRAKKFVQSVRGDLLNVVGLPIVAVKKEIRKHGWNVHHGRSTTGPRKNR